MFKSSIFDMIVVFLFFKLIFVESCNSWFSEFCHLFLLSMHQRNAQATNRSWNEPEDTESGLPLGNDFNHKQQMEVQRNREYNEFLKKVFIAQHDVAFFFFTTFVYYFLLLVILLNQDYRANVKSIQNSLELLIRIV